MGRAGIASRGFTLVEMLVVILIISVLVGLLMPALNGIRRLADRTSTVAHGEDLVHAIKLYRDSYRTWPAQTQDGTDTTYYADQYVVVNALLNNPRGEQLLEVSTGRISSNGCYLDAYNRAYIVVMDENGDGTCSVSTAAFTPSLVTNVKASVAVASWGPDPADTASRIYTWQ